MHFNLSLASGDHELLSSNRGNFYASSWLAGSIGSNNRSLTISAPRTKASEKKLGKRRILLNDDQRRRLAVKGEALGRIASTKSKETPPSIPSPSATCVNPLRTFQS
jgi:hypothetical protein